MKIIKDTENSEVIIKSSLCCLNEIECIFNKDTGNNSSARFRLTITDGGQVNKGCDIDMCGPIERADILRFLKVLISEIELLDNQK